MPSIHRFFVASLDGDVIDIQDSEAHHLIHVLRLGPGTKVELLDGRGATAIATIQTVGRRQAVAAVESVTHHQRPQRPQLTVMASPPKGDRLKWMVEKLTELGVDHFVPLQTQRTVVTPRETRLDRLHATIVSACKQSGRTRLMAVDTGVRFAEGLTAAADCRLIFAHPAASEVAAVPDRRSGRDQILMIGPEGGFTDDEVQAALAAGAELMHWPETVLRTETAAVALSAIVLSQM
jgi:16S rRNA (uracil1498-N3)-methyltransferase